MRLSHEKLAERSNLSVNAISSLERGVRRAPQPDTVASLADALGLSADERSAFETLAAATVRGGADRAEESRNNLPARLTSFVGREREIVELRALLAKHRLVTIVGLGGVGKTRLALEIAAASIDGRRDGVWFVDLASLADGTAMAARIARTCARSTSVQSVAGLLTLFERKQLTLVLDNCEHLIADVAAIVKAIVAACPGVDVLATSREPLALMGEAIFRLRPFAVPHEKSVGVAAARSYGALALFIDRSESGGLAFALTAERLRLVAAICRDLEGIPLAIELAVAWLPSLGLSALRERLHECISSVAAGLDVPERQRTMTAMLRWSHDLLSEAERILMRRVAVFAKTFSLEAAEDVCGGEGLERSLVSAILGSLVKKSLVNVVGEPERVRYEMLDPVRTFAFDLLSNAGEETPLSRRHAAWCADFADGAALRYGPLTLTAWQREVVVEMDNVRAAVHWASASARRDDRLLAGRIVGSLRAVWYSIGLQSELVRFARAALADVDEDHDPVVAERLLCALILSTHGTECLSTASRAGRLFEQVGNLRALSFVEQHIAHNLAYGGRVEEAERAISRAFALAEEARITHLPNYPGLLADRAWVRCLGGDVEAARRDCHRGIALAADGRDEALTLYLLAQLAEVELTAGDASRARAILEDVVERCRGIDVCDAVIASWALRGLACCHIASGEFELANRLGREALARSESSRDIVLSIVHVAASEAARGGSPASAARFMGRADQWFRDAGLVPLGFEARSRRVLLDVLRERLPADDFESLVASGRRLSLDRVKEEAAAS